MDDGDEKKKRAQKEQEEEAGPSSAIEKAIDDEDEEAEEEEVEEIEAIAGDSKNGVFVPGPLLSLKEQIERDKEDESLRRWKEKLLGCLESDLDGQLDPEVKFHSIAILSEDFGEIVTPLPLDEKRNDGTLFALKAGSRYQLKLKFSVLHNIVSGLTYSNTVWKRGIKVDESKGMLGTFAPQKEPYVIALKEDTTPSSVFAGGFFSAKLKFEDDDRKCHMELNYSFEIKRNY